MPLARRGGGHSDPIPGRSPAVHRVKVRVPLARALPRLASLSRSRARCTHSLSLPLAPSRPIYPSPSRFVSVPCPVRACWQTLDIYRAPCRPNATIQARARFQRSTNGFLPFSSSSSSATTTSTDVPARNHPFEKPLPHPYRE